MKPKNEKKIHTVILQLTEIIKVKLGISFDRQTNYAMIPLKVNEKLSDALVRKERFLIFYGGNNAGRCGNSVWCNRHTAPFPYPLYSEPLQ